MPPDRDPGAVPPQQDAIDADNAAFWDELCGSSLARAIGVTDASAESLQTFDAAYLEMYPYLSRYLPERLDGARLLEIGLGYGTVSQVLAERGADYHGLDIAEGPVQMVRSRLTRLGFGDGEERVRRGSALEIPHDDDTFSLVISIGCLHHTGDLQGAVEEVRRVLRPGGRAIVMVYNRRSWRQLRIRLRGLRRNGLADDAVRAAYDSNAEGEAAPVTVFVSRAEARRLFSAFEAVQIRAENFDDLVLLRGRRIPRRRLLGPPARLAGLDLYVVASKA